MRKATLLVLSVLLVAVATSAVAGGLPAIGATPVGLMLQDGGASGTLNVDVDMGNEAWYANPVWIGIGVLALILVVVLIALAARGGSTGGTTVVKG